MRTARSKLVPVSPTLGFAFCVLHFALVFAGVAIAQDEPPEEDAPLPKIEDMLLPEAETLLRGKPVDWVVLSDGDTLVVEPVAPRPDTVAKLDAELKKLANVRPKSKEEQDELKERRFALLRLQVTLISGGEDPDYTVELRRVKEIVYHEDHVLRRADRCLDQGLTATAFELLVYLDRRHHNWPGFQRLANRLLLKEAQVRLDDRDFEAALRFCEELYAKDKAFPGLSAVTGQTVDQLVQTAVDNVDYRRARHFLGRLSSRDAEHAVVDKWRTDLSTRTTAQMDLARAAAAENAPDRASELVETAARIWPETTGLRDLHRELTNRWQVLNVGVLELPDDATNDPFPSLARERWNRLDSLSWFETNRFDDTGARYRSLPCEAWEPEDLGRKLRFTLRRERAEWETRPRITSLTLSSELAARLNPDDPRYDERLAANVSGYSTPTPFELTVMFRRPPLRPEALFRIPLTLSAESPTLNPDRSADALPTELRWHKLPGEESQARAVRARPEPLAVKQRHVAEIIERKYPDWEHLLQALQRGEISAAVRVAQFDVAALKDDPRFFVLPYAQPTSHVIQIHPHSAAMQNGQLRRALLHALPRDELLWNEMLPGVPREPVVARLTASPITSGTPAANRLLPQPEYDLVLSAGLAATARRAFGGTLPTLRIACPDDVAIRRTLDRMTAHWKRVGIEVVPISSPTEEWDLAYRTVQLREPIVDLWPFLTIDPAVRVESLTPFPERLRRQLLELERATDFATAMQIIQRIQSSLLVDAWWFPLWEVDEFCLVRRNITGLPERPVIPYQDVEQWIVQPWYPQDQP